MTKVVCVEDNLDHAYLIRRCLEPFGVELVHVGDGHALLELAAAWRGQLPALVLLDVNMPGLNGVETLARLRSGTWFGRVPVVVFSTSRLVLDRERAYRAGANSYVAKPVSFAEFRVVVQRVGQYWLGLDQTAC